MSKRIMRHSAVVFVTSSVPSLHDHLLVVDTVGKSRNGIGFPGGGAEGDESPKETAIRELREETGLDASPAQVHYMFSLPCGDTLCHVYQTLAHPRFSPVASDEGEVRWVPSHALLSEDARFRRWNRVAFAAYDLYREWTPPGAIKNPADDVRPRKVKRTVNAYPSDTPAPRRVTTEEYEQLYQEREDELDRMPGGAQGALPYMGDVTTEEFE